MAAIYAPSNGDITFLSEGGRAGNFVWISSNVSTFVSIDAQQGIYIAPTVDTTGASGAWKRVNETVVCVKWFGALADDFADDRVAVQAAIDFQYGVGGGTVELANGIHRLTLTGDGVGASALILKSNVEIVGQSNGSSVLKLTCYPFLDHLAGRHPVPAGQGGPCAADRFTSVIGGLLPIALCGRTSL
ncbi:MAG: hypothetical protein V4460_12835 [Pseudomonadota bacterium]|jgi:hypothetical protein